MNNVLGFLEAKLMPLAAKTAQQRHLGAIRGAYVSFMPFIIVGSILLVISSFPNQSYQQFMASTFGASWSAIIEIPFNAVFSTMSLFISFWWPIVWRSTTAMTASPAASFRWWGF